MNFYPRSMKAIPLFITFLLPWSVFARPFDAFISEWENTDPATGGVTRIEIYEHDGKLNVHMWGRCHPTECDWGQTEAQRLEDEGGVMQVLWTQSFKDETQTLRLLDDGRLEVRSKVHFTDN